MKAQVKSKAIISSVLVTIAAVTVAIILFHSINKVTHQEGIPTSYLRATYAIDYNNMEMVVGDAHYVFVGTNSSKENTV